MAGYDYRVHFHILLPVPIISSIGGLFVLYIVYRYSLTDRYKQLNLDVSTIEKSIGLHKKCPSIAIVALCTKVKVPQECVLWKAVKQYLF